MQHKWQHELELQLHTTRHQGGSRPKVINLFSPFSFDIFCEVVLFVLIFLPARLVFSDLLYHFAFPLRLALISFPQVLESTRVQLSGYLRALWRRSLPRHWQVHRGEKEVHGSEIQWIHTVVTHSAVHTSEQVNRCDSFIHMEVHAQASRWDGFMHMAPFIA